MLSMEELLGDFDNLKISALAKSKQINAYIKNTTIGPNRSIIEDETVIPEIRTDSVLQKPPAKCYTNTNLPLINKLRAEKENKRQNEVQKAMDSHINRILEFSKRKSLDSNQQLQQKKQVLLSEKQQQEMLILQVLEQHDKDASEKLQQQEQYYEELAERRKKISKELQDREKRKQLLVAIMEKIKKNQLEFRNVYQEIVNTFKNCKHQNQLKEVLGEIPKQIKLLPDSMDEITSRCRDGKISENDSRRSSELVQEIKEILKQLQEKVLEVTREAEKQQQQKQQQIQQRQQLKPEVKLVTTQQLPQPTQPNSTPISIEPVQKSEAVPTKIDKFISRISLRTYSELQDHLDNHLKTFEELIKNDAFKQFRFSCQKAVNIPVNAISAVSSQHLLDKYNRLSSLLAGKLVEVGGTQVCAAKHPQGVSFCKNLLAKKFVLQGDLMISSNPEAAFCYAAIIVSLWNDYPDFGKLLLAHFHRQCPYLVPFYPPRSVEQSDEEYYRSQGYQYTDGIVEKQDKFLKRMTGIMRLYSAIIIASPKRGQQENPHGLVEGWRWFAAFLNLEPKPDITATMLHVFFEIAGSTMQAIYGKMFQRAMNFVCRVYLPMIQKIDSGGPVTRLEVLLQEYMRQGQFEPPRDMVAGELLWEEDDFSLTLFNETDIKNKYLQFYLKLQIYLQDFINNYEDILHDDRYLSLRFKCIFAVDFIIDHQHVLKDPSSVKTYTQLLNVLTGKHVFDGGTYIPPIKFQQALDFCTHLLAQKFIKMHTSSLDENVRCCHAELIILLWNKIPHFGKLLLASFFKECPYLVPLYPQFNSNLHIKECYIEKMVGIMRLFATIMILNPNGRIKNPYGLSKAWCWLAAFLNLQPCPDISAALLLAFLETAGLSLQFVYGKIFNKIIKFIWNTYLPLLHEVGSKESFQKLKDFLYVFYGKYRL